MGPAPGNLPAIPHLFRRLVLYTLLIALIHEGIRTYFDFVRPLPVPPPPALFTVIFFLDSGTLFVGGGHFTRCGNFGFMIALPDGRSVSSDDVDRAWGAASQFQV